MKISDAGLALIKSFERCKRTSYLPTPNDVPTIGWGSTGPDIKLGMCWTQSQCDARFAKDLEFFERGVERRLQGAPTTASQFSAMVALAYNIGFGDATAIPPKAGFETSSVLRRHKLGNHAGAADAFLMWIKQKGKVLPGLIRRREAERELYLA